jgi:hypothetical protein
MQNFSVKNSRNTFLGRYISNGKLSFVVLNYLLVKWHYNNAEENYLWIVCHHYTCLLGVKLGLSHSRQDSRFRMFENKMLRRIFGPKERK